MLKTDEMTHALFVIATICCITLPLMESKATLLTTAEAEALAGELLDQARGRTRDTSINMASAYLTPEGEVSISLLGAVERHSSISSFLRAYEIRWPDKKG